LVSVSKCASIVNSTHASQQQTRTFMHQKYSVSNEFFKNEHDLLDLTTT